MSATITIKDLISIFEQDISLKKYDIIYFLHPIIKDITQFSIKENTISALLSNSKLMNTTVSNQRFAEILIKNYDSTWLEIIPKILKHFNLVNEFANSFNTIHNTRDSKNWEKYHKCEAFKCIIDCFENLDNPKTIIQIFETIKGISIYQTIDISEQIISIEKYNKPIFLQLCQKVFESKDCNNLNTSKVIKNFDKLINHLKNNYDSKDLESIFNHGIYDTLYSENSTPFSCEERTLIALDIHFKVNTKSIPIKQAVLQSIDSFLIKLALDEPRLKIFNYQNHGYTIVLDRSIENKKNVFKIFFEEISNLNFSNNDIQNNKIHDIIDRIYDYAQLQYDIIRPNSLVKKNNIKI